MSRQDLPRVSSDYDDEGYRPIRPRRRRGCWLGLLASALFASCGAVIVAALLFISGQPNAIRVQVNAPKTVTANDTFTVEVTIENISLDAVTIRGVGLETALLEGASVAQSEPAFRATKDRSVPIYGDWREFALNRTVLGGNKLVVTLTLQANAPGVYSGDVTVWVEGDVFGVPFARARREPLEFEVR